jgi:hypothetical protein
MPALLVDHPQLLGLTSLLICVGLAAVVIAYVLTDRRRDHHHRMSAMALDDDSTGPGATHE